MFGVHKQNIYEDKVNETQAICVLTALRCLQVISIFKNTDKKKYIYHFKERALFTT